MNRWPFDKPDMIKMLRLLVVVLLCFQAGSLISKPVIRIEVSAGSVSHTDVPVSIRLEELGSISMKKVRLVEIIGGKRVEKPFQVVSEKEARIYWKLDGLTAAGSTRTFEFEKGKPTGAAPVLADKQHDDLVLMQPDKKPLLTYRYTVKMPPQGVDPLYGRGGYIHPLYTPSGKVLTRIQPPDHYHHYGIWNPWTKISYGGKEYDLWNLKDNKGTVRFAHFDQIDQGPVFAGFEAVHDHVIFHTGQEENIIRENWKIQVFPVDESRYFCDITSELNPTEKADVILKEYRYAGLGFRATEQWTNKNSEVRTSSGKTWKEADGSLERWAIVSGDLGGSTGGILFMSFPQNYNFPEPIRVWPIDGNGGRGDQFFNFSPTKNKDWMLQAGKSYTLTYRLLVFDGTLSTDEAESIWQSFAHPPQVRVVK